MTLSTCQNSWAARVTQAQGRSRDNRSFNTEIPLKNSRGVDMQQCREDHNGKDCPVQQKIPSRCSSAPSQVNHIQPGFKHKARSTWEQAQEHCRPEPTPEERSKPSQRHNKQAISYWKMSELFHIRKTLLQIHPKANVARFLVQENQTTKILPKTNREEEEEEEKEK